MRPPMVHRDVADRLALPTVLLCTMAALLTLLTFAVPRAHAAEQQAPFRTVVTTDGSGPRGDDAVSFYRLLMYSNEFADSLKGVVYSSSFNAWNGDRDLYQRIIREEYSLVYTNLRKHDPRYPSPEHLLSLVKFGSLTPGGNYTTDTEGSNLIKSLLLDQDPRPVHLQAWGGLSTIGAALHSIEAQYSSSPNWASIKRAVSAKAKIYNILDQDAVFKTYVDDSWPEVDHILNHDQFFAFAYPNARIGGPGAGFPRPFANPRVPLALEVFFEPPIMDQITTGPLLGNMPTTIGNALVPDGSCLCEGDTPAFLHLIDTGLRSYQDPSYGGWGGRFMKVQDHRWADGPEYAASPVYWRDTGIWSQDPNATEDASPYPGYDAWYPQTRWLQAIQHDLAARAAWQTASFEDANHAPAPATPHPDLVVPAGQRVSLSASATDPDGDTVALKWWQYPEAGTYAGHVAIDGATTREAGFTVPSDAKAGDTIHVILEATDSGTPALTRYQRVVVTVATPVAGQVGGTVPATLSLTLGVPASFGSFTPGVAGTYSATTSANVISSAGDATLSVADPSSTATGRLVNGSFALASPVQAGVGGTFAPVGGSAVPTALKTWSAPVSNDSVTVAFRQQIAANEPLRTGAYSKTLTFTLSTTQP